MSALSVASASSRHSSMGHGAGLMQQAQQVFAAQQHLAASAQFFPKPSPLHLTYGNAPAALFAVGTAKQAHAEHWAAHNSSSRPTSSSPTPLSSRSMLDSARSSARGHHQRSQSGAASSARRAQEQSGDGAEDKILRTRAVSASRSRPVVIAP